MTTRPSVSIIISGIFIIIGINLYSPEAGFTFKNAVGIASIIFFGILAAFAIYKSIKQLIYTKQSV